MTQYKSVKVTFDLDDNFHLKIYNYLKQRTNGSSYIRTLIHQDMYFKNAEEVPSSLKHTASTLEYNIVKEQETIDNNISSTELLDYQNDTEDEDDVSIEDLI
jgi:hypothetical protein